MTARPRSLRTTLVAGLVLLQALVVAGVTATVWAHARRVAHEQVADELRVRASTLSGLLEFEGGEPALDVSERALPEYFDRSSGIYAAVCDEDGSYLLRAPSLGRRELAPAGAWREGEFDFREIERGPDGFPCAAVTYSFVAPEETDEARPPAAPGAVAASVAADLGLAAPPAAAGARRCRIVVARDARPRDASVADLAWFLGLLAAGATTATAGGGLLVARRVLAPVRRMTDEAAALTPEDTSRRLRPESVVRELGSLAGTLNSALDRLGEALDRQRRFTSDASHELRTPLASLRGNAELLLRRDRTAAEYREGLERQARIAAGMTDVVENLLTLARADAGRLELGREPVAMGALVRDVAAEFEARATERRIDLACDAEECAVVGDRTQLAGVVRNLLSNAVKFAPAGGAVRATVRREGADAVVEVTDTGPGVPAEERARVFERFHRVRGGTDPHEGAGLGLAIAAWAVRAHGGTIEAGERPGGGAAFRVRLPAGSDPEAFTGRSPGAE